MGKLRKEILRRWRANEITLVEAARLLFDTGVVNAWEVLERS